MTNELERLSELLRKHPGWGRRKIAKELGLGERRTRTLLKKLKRESNFVQPQPEAEPARRGGITFEDSGTTGYVSSESSEIKTLEDLLAYAKVDTNLWSVDRFVVNKWDMGYKDADKQANTLPLYQIKAWLKKRVIVEETRQLVQELLTAFKEEAPARPEIQYSNKSDGVMLEVSIFDLHLGKLCWGPECGINYDSKIAQTVFKEALETLVSRTAGYSVERVLMPIGNDAMNVDNAANTTTAGTPQREDGRWQKSFVATRKLMCEAILRLREIAPVDVLMIPGNHDRERVFYLGDTLSGWFSRTPGVTINNSPMVRKYYQWGENLLGFTHGNEERHLNLPLIMATEEPQLWAKTRFREFHCGHWHHKKDIHFQPVQEFNGIRVRLIPSLCPADDWHRLKGYNGLRSAELYVWEKNNGCVGTFSYSPSEATG